jgi:hypothetical protein
MPTEPPPLVRKVSAKFADRGCHVVSVTNSYGRNLGFLDLKNQVIRRHIPEERGLQIKGTISEGATESLPGKFLCFSSGGNNTSIFYSLSLSEFPTPTPLRFPATAMARIFRQDAKTLKEGSAISSVAYMTTPGVHAPCGTQYHS